MALFTKKDTGSLPEAELTAELLQLIAVAADEQDARLAAARDNLGIGGASEWAADLAAGTISFTSPSRVLTGPVQFIGSYSPATSTWLWGWANTGLPEHVTTSVSAAAAHGDANGITALTAPKLGGVDESLATELAVVAIHLAGAGTLYRAAAGENVVFLAFGELG